MTTTDRTREDATTATANADDGAAPASTRRPTARKAAKRDAGDASLVEVRRSGIQGRGVYARRAIAKGTRIIEYTGERISGKEADRRAEADDMMGRHVTFMYLVSDRVVIDAASFGSDARFINHSCDPNCETFVERGRVFVDAIKDIAAGEELSYDYWYTTDDSYSEEDLRRIYPCRCGARICRGTLAKPRERAKPKPKPKLQRKRKR